jgi:hypothetical protein
MLMPVLVLVAWLGTVIVVAWMVQGIVKAAINKAEPGHLPQVLDRLDRLVTSVVHELFRRPLGSRPPIAPPHNVPTGHTEETAPGGQGQQHD